MRPNNLPPELFFETGRWDLELDIDVLTRAKFKKNLWERFRENYKWNFNESKYITTSRRFKCVFLKWLIPLDVLAWRLNLFLWALLSVASESVSNNFGFIRFEEGEIFWRETSKRLQKTGTMLQLRDYGRTDLWTYPFFRDVWMIMK